MPAEPAIDKLPGMTRDPAETTDTETPANRGISFDQKARKIDRRISVAPMMDWTDDPQNTVLIKRL
jgi:hypothetical protein